MEKHQYNKHNQITQIFFYNEKQTVILLKAEYKYNSQNQLLKIIYKFNDNLFSHIDEYSTTTKEIIKRTEFYFYTNKIFRIIDTNLDSIQNRKNYFPKYPKKINSIHNFQSKN